MKRSETYRKNRASQKFPHTTGTRSFAQIREDERAKMPNGSEPERNFLFVKTHKPTPGKPMADATAKAISKINDLNAQQPEASQNGNDEDDILSQTIGKDQHSHVRTYGLGPTRSDIWGKKSVNVEETATLEATTNEDNARLRNQVNVMEQKQKDMEAKLERYEQLEAKLQRYEQLEDKIKRYEQFLDMCTNHPQFLVQDNMASGATRVLETSNAPTNSLAPQRSYSSSSHGTRTTKETVRKSATKSVRPH